MGQAKILSGGSNGLYNIELQFDVAYATARIAVITARLTALVPLIPAAVTAVSVAQVALSAAQQTLDLAVTPEEKTAAMKVVLEKQNTLLQKQRALSALNLEKSSITKEKAALVAVPSKETRNNVWCVDLTENLTVGQAVGTIELNGEISQILVTAAGLVSTSLGKIQPTQSSTPSAVFLNWARQACWQKWKPTYRVGTIKALYQVLNSADVCLDDVRSKTKGLPINQAGVTCSRTLGELYSGLTRFAEANPTHPMILNTATTSITMTEQLMTDLNEVNTQVNTTHKYKQDPDKLDTWNFLDPGADGDCEDFALTKIQQLLDKGYPPSAVKIEGGKTGLDKGHAWVTVNTTEGQLCLDINYSGVMPSDSLPYTERSVLTGTTWERTGVLLQGVPVEYMNGANSSAFEVGDRIIVQFTNQAWATRKVIGFETNPRGAGQVYMGQDGYVYICDRTTGALKATAHRVESGATNYSYVTVFNGELYLTYIDASTDYDVYADVYDANTGVYKRRISMDFVPPALDLMFFRVGGLRVDRYSNVWISAWFMTSTLVNYAGFWGYNQAGVKIASQDQHGTGPDVLHWGRPGQIAIWEGPSGDVTYVVDKTLLRIKQFKTSSISDQIVYNMTQTPMGITVYGANAYVLVMEAGVVKLRTYSINSTTGSLTFVSMTTLFTPTYTWYEEIDTSQDSLWVSEGLAGGVDSVHRYDLNGVELSSVSLPARSGGNKFIYVR